MTGIKILQKADVASETPRELLSAFQLGQAKVKSQNAIKELEFYGEIIHEPEFKQYLLDKITALCNKLMLVS